MKRIYLYLPFLFLFASITCADRTMSSESAGKIQIKGNLVGCAKTDSIRLYEWMGVEMQPVATSGLKEKKGVYNYNFKVSDLPTGFYFIGTSPQIARPIILGTEAKVELRGKCDSIQQMTVLKSPVNQLHDKIIGENAQINQEFSMLMRQMRGAARNPQLKDQLMPKFADLDARRMKLYNETKAKSPFLGKMVGLYTYLNFLTNQGDYKTEGEYFAENYFQFADLSDPDYARMPTLLQQMQPYAQTLAQVGMTAEKQGEYIDKLLTKSEGSPATYKSVLLGTVLGYSKSRDKTNFVKYGGQLLSRYTDLHPNFVAQVEQQIQQASKLMVGAEAPEITQATPNGKTSSLSDLRGKVVLLDFWASWCGPCRRDNPKVVKIYNKYKNQGFEVFGVSLDGNKDRWLKAIEKDQLTWTHVSDLKKWKSAAAQLYGVKSIPQTFLLDKEGKILAKNLKGPALEQKIQEALKN